MNNNISLLVNQNDQIQHILSDFHHQGKLQGNILDFTVRHFQYLYLLYAKSVVVIDFKDLLTSRTNTQISDLQIVETIQLEKALASSQIIKQKVSQQPENKKVVSIQPQSQSKASTINLSGPTNQTNSNCIFSHIEVANDQDQSLLLFSDIAIKSHNQAFIANLGETVKGKSTGDELVQTQTAETSANVSTSSKVQDKESGSGFCEILHIDCSRFRNSKAGLSSFQNKEHNLQFQEQQFGSWAKDGAEKNSGQHLLTFLSTEHFVKGRLLDVEIWDSYIALLFEKNLVIVFDLKHSESVQNEANETVKFHRPIFKAAFADATDQITQLFFISDFQKSVKEPQQSLSDDSIEKGLNKSNDSFKKSNKLSFDQDITQQKKFLQNKRLQGHFLMVETKQPSSIEQKSKNKQTLSQSFKKLHIGQIQDNIGALYLKDKPGQIFNPKQSQQNISQVAQLTIKENMSKFVKYEQTRGIIFMMNQEKQDRLLRLYTIKLKKEMIDDSDSDDCNQTNIEATLTHKFRFEYITEVRLQISNKSFSYIQSKIQNQNKTAEIYQLPQPIFLELINCNFDQYEQYDSQQNQMTSADNQQIYIYTTIMDSVLVFQRNLLDLTPTSTQLVRVLSGIKEPPPQSNINDQKIQDQSNTKIQQNQDSKSKFVNQQAQKLVNQIINNINQDDGNQNLGEQTNENRNDSCNDLQHSSKAQQQNKENANIAAYKKSIEMECDDEAIKDEKMLQKKLDEAVREAMSDHEQNSNLNKIAHQPEPFDFGIIDELALDSLDPVQVNSTKIDSHEDDTHIFDAQNDQDDQDDRMQTANQSLSKKERKAQKKQEKKIKKKESAGDEQGSSPTKTDQILKQSSQPQISPKDHEKDLQNQQLGLSVNTNQTNLFQVANKKKLQKVQEQQVIENIGELTRKYQELAQKTNQLQQLLSRQQQQKQEVEALIKKSVKDSVGDRIIGQHVRDLVVPLLTKKIKTVDDQVNEIILPKVESQIEATFQQLIERYNLISSSNHQESSPKSQEVSIMIQKEFRHSLQNLILPSIEKTFKEILGNVEKKLQTVDLALCEKLFEEEERWKQMESQYQNSLNWLKLFHKKVGQMAQEMIAQQINEQAQLQQRVVFEQIERDIMAKLQTQMQSNLQIQVQQKVQEYFQFQVPQMIQMQIQQHQNIQYQPTTHSTPIGVYSMNLPPPQLETQLSQSSAQAQAITPGNIFAIQKQPSQTLMTGNQSPVYVEAAFKNQIGQMQQQSNTKPIQGVTQNFMNQFKQIQSKLQDQNADQQQREKEQNIRAMLIDIDQETANFREQIQLIQRQIRFDSHQAIQQYGSIENTNRILSQFEQQQDQKKTKLIDQLNLIKVEINESKDSHPNNTEVQSNNDDIINRFLISKKKAKSRELQSNVFGSKLKAPQQLADDDIFRELDNQGDNNFLGEELGYRGLQDSEHEDSEDHEYEHKQPPLNDDKDERDDYQIKDDNDRIDYHASDRQTNTSSQKIANQYLQNQRTMRPYDDDCDDSENDKYQSQNIKHRGQITSDTRNQRQGPSNRGAMKLLSANQPIKNTYQKHEFSEQNSNQFYRGSRHSDEQIDSCSSQGGQTGYQYKDQYQKLKQERGYKREKQLKEGGGDDLGIRRKPQFPKPSNSSQAGNNRQLTSWKDTYMEQ